MEIAAARFDTFKFLNFYTRWKSNQAYHTLTHRHLLIRGANSSRNDYSAAAATLAAPEPTASCAGGGGDQATQLRPPSPWWSRCPRPSRPGAAVQPASQRKPIHPNACATSQTWVRRQLTIEAVIGHGLVSSQQALDDRVRHSGEGLYPLRTGRRPNLWPGITAEYPRCISRTCWEQKEIDDNSSQLLNGDIREFGEFKGKQRTRPPVASRFWIRGANSN